MGSLGKWITNGTDRPFYARREISVGGRLLSAEAKVCGLGQFMFWINGEKVGDHELDPGWTDYGKVIQYVSFDVTDYLRTGANVLGVEVGNGWYIKNDEHYTFHMPPFMPPNPNPYRPYGDSLVLALELTLRYADGQVERIGTDENFRVRCHPVIQSNVFGSETMDGRLCQHGWAEMGFDDSAWDIAQVVAEGAEPTGELVEQTQPPIKVIRSYEGKHLHTVAERDIYSFGQNMAGMLRFSAKGKTGDIVRMYPAEKLGPDGDVDQMAKNWMEVDSVLTYIIGQDDRWETFCMKFTYFAGMVVAVEKSDPRIEVRDLYGDALTSAWAANGEFSCDDPRYEQIYQMIERSVEANMLSVHTDCPTIERFPWQEANHLMAPSIMYMKDGRKLWEKFLMDMRAAQHTAEDWFVDFEGNRFYPGEGLVPSRCPCYMPDALPVPGMGSFYDVAPWGSASILCVRWHYLFYGDRGIIEDNYDMGMRYLAHLKRKINGEGFLNHGLGDWGNPERQMARENVETAFLYADAVTMAEFAGILGRESDRAELLSFAEEVKANYNAKLLVQDSRGAWYYRSWESGGQMGATQACQALPLYWGMVPPERERDVEKALRRLLEEKGAFVTGEIGLPYIIQCASNCGMNDLIADFVTREEHPSYYAFIKDGMTTLGEYWETNPRSHCHDMMGHIVEWYYNGMAGIRPVKPGFEEIEVKPYLPKSMGALECRYNSAAGPIEVMVRRHGGKMELTVRTPAGMVCRIDTSELEKQGMVTVAHHMV